jgi:bla regulator protein BlaR1
MTPAMTWPSGGVVDLVGWALVHFLWQGALLAAATAAVLALLRNARPQVRYLVACGGLLACVLWPMLTLFAGLQDTTGAATATVAMQASARTHAASLQQSMGWIVAGWAACSLVLVMRFALGLAWIARAARTGALDAHWQARLDTLARAMGVARHVRLRIVDHLASPVTALWWRPVVLVPAGLLSGMPPELLQALLAHEMAHIRRHDYLVNLLQNLAEILLFYHPAVWWLSRRIRFERELIADDIAAGHAGGGRQLAHALAELEKSRFGHHEPALAAHGGDLMHRITHLLRPTPQRKLSTAALTTVTALLSALVMAGCAVSHAVTPATVDRPDQRGMVLFDSCSKPVWPQAALAAQQTGTVTLAFLVGADGTAQDSKVVKSSGHAALDEAARGGIVQCRFRPAVNDGRPVAAWLLMQYAWVLE